ncbi:MULTISPECIES: helix-turn-helix domain-containing protein [Cohnella]|jgi:AcrR family transcriptional regulator|uniref:helix-turn-helix domain-containing protein n=1 Tax=Cohnella TaxID=329857 RepID=UPI00036D49F8|nr:MULTISPECIES: helix-turn-helix domain-containing protein [Cohnella]REK67199.1 MAG: TetR/AcrR family transcriptional regulator [Cohnella sp.]
MQILEAAERVFTRKGYEPATIKDIVEEANMSRGWIYLYYQTKEEIFEDLMEKIDQDQAKQRTA